MSEITYRMGTEEDTIAIAHVHARSWKIHYRGVLSDHYLDHEVEADRLAVWTPRMQETPPHQYVILAEENQRLCGLGCVFLHQDEQWGALLDNLHVIPEVQGRGVGKELLHKCGQWVYHQAPDSSMYLWVFEANEAAIAFYERVGGIQKDRQMVDNPGGGSAPIVRYVWTDLAGLEKNM